MKTKKRILIICVNHNSYAELKNYIKSIEEVSCSDYEIIIQILDNSQEYDGEFYEVLCAKSYSFGNIRVRREINSGYFGTIYNYLEKENDCDKFEFVIISNVDVSLDSDFIQRLDEVDIRPSLGIIAPSIETMRGVNKNPKIASPISKTKLLLNRFLFRFSVLHVLLITINSIRLQAKRKIMNSSEADGVEKDIYAAHGSFIIFTQKGFALFSQLSYPVFLFGEEIFLAEEFRSNGMQTCFVPKVRVFDKEHSSTGNLTSRRYRELNIEALTYLISHYFRRR